MLVACITVLPTASATHVEVTIPATGGQYELTVQLTKGDTFVFGWTSTIAIGEVFRDPNGAVIKAEVGTSTGGIGYVVPATGEYTMTWTNLQSSSATLKVDYFPNVNNIIESWILLMIVGLLVLVVVVVIIVLLVMKKPKAPPMPPQYQAPPPPPSS